jgi:hypothetical protein
VSLVIWVLFPYPNAVIATYFHSSPSFSTHYACALSVPVTPPMMAVTLKERSNFPTPDIAEKSLQTVFPPQPQP